MRPTAFPSSCGVLSSCSMFALDQTMSKHSTSPQLTELFYLLLDGNGSFMEEYKADGAMAVCGVSCVLVLPAVSEPVGELLWNEGRLRFDSAL